MFKVFTLFILVELNKLVRKLTRRLTKRVHTGFKPKERVLSEPSELPAPVDAPDWAVQ